MLIRSGYNIALRLASPTAVLYVLHVHPSRKGDLVMPENFRIEPALPVEDYFDGFGNHCGRVNASAGMIRFLNDAIIRDPDPEVAPVTEMVDSILFGLGCDSDSSTSGRCYTRENCSGRF